MLETVQLSLFLLIGGAQLVNSRAVARIGIWLVRQSIHWHRAMASPIVVKISKNVKENLHFIAQSQIFLSNSFFSKTDSHS